MQRLFALLALVPIYTYSAGLEEGIRRVRAHLLIEDQHSALLEAEKLADQFPNERSAKETLIEALAANGLEEQALDAWNRLSLQYPDLLSDRRLLEELSWGVLRKGSESTQYGIRLSSMIGAYLTHDVRAVPILLKMMRDSNAIVRSVALQLASAYGDAPLKDEVARQLQEEKVWMVRLEAIRAAGAMRMKQLAPKLQAIVQSDRSTYEERHLAIGALVQIYDRMTLPELKLLAQSNRAGMRHLACSIAAHFRMEDAKEEILRLIKDPSPDVKIAAINALGLFYRETMKNSDVTEVLASPLQDPNAAVAITAGWAAILVDRDLGEKSLSRWVGDSLAENRRLAAAALAAAGSHGAKLSAKVLKESEDPFARANVAIGLLGQRVEVKRCCDVIYELLNTEKRMWMMDNRANPLFQVLAPSQVRHVDQIPNYPEAIDQTTRLQLVSSLAIVEDPRATEALKSFLQRKNWGLTGVAAATLLQEGDEAALEVVRQLLNDPDANIRLQACLVLAFYGRDESVIGELQKAYIGADHERKLHILEALGRIGNTETHSFLISVLREPFPILRIAASAAFIQSLSR